MKNLVFKRRFFVPIYEVYVWIVVAHDAAKAANRLANRFNMEKETGWMGAATSEFTVRGECLAVFSASVIDEESIAHEMRHVEDFLMEYIGNRCTRCKEKRPYLTGFLQKRVKTLLKKHKVRLN